MLFFCYKTFQKCWRRICIVVIILTSACVIYLYNYPIYYTWNFYLNGIHSKSGVHLQITKFGRGDEVRWTDGISVNGGVIVDVKIDTEKTNSNVIQSIVISEYRLPLLFTFSTTPIIYGTRKSNNCGQYVYYDRIEKKTVFVINDKTIEITHRGKYLVYNGISIVIDKNSTLNIQIDKDGVLSVTRSDIYYP